MSILEQKIRKTFKRNGFALAAELMDFRAIPAWRQKAMLASWDNYPQCMNIYPTHLLVKRTYEED